MGRCKNSFLLDILLLLALQSLVNLSFFQNCPTLFSVLHHMSLIPYAHVLQIILNWLKPPNAATWIRFWSASLIYRDRMFQIPTHKSLFMLDLCNCFLLVFNFRSFWTKHIFYGVGLSAPHPACNLEKQGVPFYLGDHLWPVSHGGLYQ